MFLIGLESSSRIVPSPWESVITAFVAPERSTVNFSTDSTILSSIIVSVIVLVRSAGKNVRVPERGSEVLS